MVGEIIIPREAMGFGDVKFIAAIGAFLGWKAVFFTVLACLDHRCNHRAGNHRFGQREWSAKIPFGPYLAFGRIDLALCRPADHCVVLESRLSAPRLTDQHAQPYACTTSGAKS
jgi:hypothetical protein